MLRFARSIYALSFLCLGALATRASAQISYTWGPELAPLGCSFYFNLSNDGPDEVVYDPCGLGVFDASGALVFSPPCGGPVLMPMGSVHHWIWPQTDMSAQPVAAGLYNLHYLDGTGLPGISIRVGAAQAAIAPLGSSKTGTTHAYRLCAPLDGGFAYWVAASGAGAAGIPSCGGNVPLVNDGLLQLSLGGGPWFPGFAGVLDAAGVSEAPALAIPPEPALAGFELRLAFVVLDASAPCPIRRISAPHELEIH